MPRRVVPTTRSSHERQAAPSEELLPTYRALFDSFTRTSADQISPIDVINRLAHAGLAPGDPRVAAVMSAFSDAVGNGQMLGLDDFATVCRRNSGIVARAIRGQLVIPDFARFAEDLDEIYRAVRENRDGSVADYIPQLGRVDPEQFAVALCTTDGQRTSLGDEATPFCVQSVCKPVNYCLALEELGAEVVHRHVGREPSGRGFNELTLNGDGLPHNPMINAGAIMTASLIRRGSPIADRFDHVADTWRRLAPGCSVGFNNAVYLSERQTADRNFALGYFMREHGAFPPSTDLIETLEFYFQTCSIDVDVRGLAMVAATLANGGVSPLTDERIFSSGTVRKCLSLMSSCGMYDFSGEFAFSIGVPAKSGVSGAIMVVIPQVLGLAVWSPRLDALGNSVRGIALCKELVSRFTFHVFDSLDGGVDKRDPTLSKNQATSDGLVRLCWAASQGDLDEIRSLVASGVDPSLADYDGRTALHLAASEGQLDVVRYLLDLGVPRDPVDRWGGTPHIDAERGAHGEIVTLLRPDGDDGVIDGAAMAAVSA